MKTIEIENFASKNATILNSGIWGVYHFTIGNLEVERKTFGFLGGGVHKHSFYVIRLNGKDIRVVDSYRNILINYTKLLMSKNKAI